MEDNRDYRESEVSAEISLEQDTSKPTKSTARKKKNKLKEKLIDLVSDKRPWYKRLIVAALAALAFVYTLIVFGFLDIYINNASFFTFTFSELLKPTILLGVAMFAVITGFLMLCRGRLFNYFTTVFFSITLCAYVQCNLLENTLGSLDGSDIEWELMTNNMLLNILVWALVFIIPFVVHYFNRKVWRKFVSFVSALLIFMQTAGLIGLVVTNDFLDASSGGYLSDRTIYEVSPQKNTIVFLVDRMGYSTSQTVFEKYPDIKEGLSGFTGYSNAIGSYTRTFPSVIYLLTGVKWDPDLNVGSYFNKAWTESEFMMDIQDAGYECKAYTEVNYVIKNTDNAIGRLDNVGDKKLKANPRTLLKSMFDLSMYRYSPLAMKPFFWCYTGDLGRISTTADGSFASDIYATDDPGFYANLMSDGITVKEDSKGSFIFYHMRGAHDPFVMDENGNRVQSKDTDVWKQTAGNMRTIIQYMDMLKEKGLYDDTTIIITADHGLTGTLPELDGPRTISCFIKPAGETSDEPLKTNEAPITHDNIRSYILKSLDIDYSKYAPAVDEIAEDADITRYFYMSACDPLRLHRDTYLVTYTVTGNAHDFENWKEIERKPIDNPFYDAG